MTHDIEPLGVDKGWAAQMLAKSIGMTREQLVVFFVAYLLHAAGADPDQPYNAGGDRKLWLRKLRMFTGLPLKRVENAVEELGDKIPKF